MNLEAMLNPHPGGRGGADELTLRAAEACFECAQVCVACADACLAAESVDDLRQCIRMNLDCADLCCTAGLVGARLASHDRSIAGAIFGLCAEMCRRCGDECMRQAPHHEHCRICAEACRSCEQACRNASTIPDLHQWSFVRPMAPAQSLSAVAPAFSSSAPNFHLIGTTALEQR